MKAYSTLFALVLLPILGFSQLQTLEYKELVNATASENGINLLNAFSGGFNSTQPAHADLNNDGKNDLTIYDHNTRTLKTFINIGGPGDILYQYDPKYAANFPTIRSYMKLIDFNCDSIPDLFHRGTSGVSVHFGSYDNNELKFTFYRELYYPGTFGPINCYVQPNDIPIIADLDGDGDIDVAAFDVLGFKAPFYKNMQVEAELPCDSMRMILGVNCYGQMHQTFFRTHQLNTSCKGGPSSSNKKQRHSGNCILSVDLNNDGLLDMLGGNISFSDIQALYNGGTTSNAIFTSQDSLFDDNGHQLELFSWPAPFYFDIDNDNDKDLVFTPHTDDKISANYNAMAVYENTGTATNTNFVYKNDSALIASLIDVGRNSHPTLFDYDKDGKLDLFIGNESYFNTVSKSGISQIAYYKNMSTPGQVDFALVTKDFLNLSSKNYKGLYPTFGDVTGDGIDDLLMGTDSGKIIVYENLATSNTTQASFNWITDSLQGIDVGDYSFPFVYDFNGDGKTDILIGNEVGYIAIYQDTAAVSTLKEFKLMSATAGNMQAGGAFTYLGNAVPYVGQIDSTNKEYLLVGTSEGIVERYDSFANNLNNWVQVDSQMAKIQVALRTAPAIGDIDGDLRPELLLGNQNGGINIFQFVKYQNNWNVGLVSLHNKSVEINLYPNPSQNELWIKAPSDITTLQSYTIYDIAGRLVQKNMQQKQLSQSISTANLTNGMYFIDISFGDNLRAKGKFMKKD